MAEGKGAEKKVKKALNPNQKRGQPTAAARLISSPYINYGWHKPLTRNVKEIVQKVSSAADSMYMLQIARTRPVDSLSLRNGIFWEHRQLADHTIVSTPAVDHIDLFPTEERLFEETRWKLSKDYVEGDEVLLHYLFEGMRHREFLILPVEVDDCWVTIVARMQQKSENDKVLMDVYTDREVTDLAIIDPVPENREARFNFIRRRFTAILAEGCIELSKSTTVLRNLTVSDINPCMSHRWQAGLIAYAVSREFLRRLKLLQWRRENDQDPSREFLWAPFEEHYNFDNYRQSLMAACAHQCIEKAGYQVRLALEVPSDESNYDPEGLGSSKDSSDEKWDVFQSPSHTLTLRIPARPWANNSPIHSPTSSMSSFVTPRYNRNASPPFSPTPGARDSPQCSPTTFPKSGREDTDGDEREEPPTDQEQLTPKFDAEYELDDDAPVMSTSRTSGYHQSNSNAAIGEDHMAHELRSYSHNAPTAPMGAVAFSAHIPGLNLIHQPPYGAPPGDHPYLRPSRDPVFAITPTGLSPAVPSTPLEENGSHPNLHHPPSYVHAASEGHQPVSSAALENMDRFAGLKRSFSDEDNNGEQRPWKRQR